MKIEHNKELFTNQLLAWFQENKRILPWREDVSAYRVWVSEIMLQQTRVEAVKPYFERFIKEIPTLKDLAQAEDDKLFKLWEGLGYYQRIRNMKKCAQECMDVYQGKLPQTLEELKTLAGIGDYTAGAVASIAYGALTPAVDGNVLRVFSRVLLSEDDILKDKTKKKFHNIIKEYIPVNKSSEFNQALMELGALICVPNAAPRCNICPVSSECLGYHSGDAHRLPNKMKKKPRRIEYKSVCVVECQDTIYLRQRKHEGLLADLYEFLCFEGTLKKKDILQKLAHCKVLKIEKMKDTRHIFSHIEWHMKGYFIKVEYPNIDGIWCKRDEIEQKYAIPTAYKAYRDRL